MFNSAFNDIGADPGDYSPRISGMRLIKSTAHLRNGEQTASTAAEFAYKLRRPRRGDQPLFATLDLLEHGFSDRLTWWAAASPKADWRLFTTLCAFDPVYCGAISQATCAASVRLSPISGATRA